MIALTSHDYQQSRRKRDHSHDSDETAPSPSRFAGGGLDSVGVVAAVTHQHQCKIGFHEVTTEHQADVR